MNKNKVTLDFNFKIKTTQWKDKKTGCWIIYSKKYGISSYGVTKKQALEMFNAIVNLSLKFH